MKRNDAKNPNVKSNAMGNVKFNAMGNAKPIFE